MHLNAVPYEQLFTNIDAQLQSDTAPDVFRVDYYNLGTYAGRGQLLDLSPLLGQRRRRPVHPRGVAGGAVRGQAVRRPAPHRHLRDPLQPRRCSTAAGITSVPTTLDEAWTWEEFAQVAAKLRGTLPDATVPLRRTTGRATASPAG